MGEATKKTLAMLTAGSRVCEVGYGISVMVHRHRTVHHITKTQIVVEVTHGVFARFHRADGRSMPYQPYGGTQVFTTCQRPATRKESQS